MGTVRPTAPGAALPGVRVRDMTRILADMGAEVITTERPGEGHDTRRWGPPNRSDEGGRDLGAACFQAANRGKRSVVVGTARPEGQRVPRALAAQCDVVNETFKVGGPAADPRRAANPGRVRHRDVLIPILPGLIPGRSLGDRIGALNAAHVPAGPVNTIDPVFADAQVIAFGMRTESPTPGGGPADGCRLAHQDVAHPARSAAPAPGADRLAVLDRLLDPSDFDLAALMADGTLGGGGATINPGDGR